MGVLDILSQVRHKYNYESSKKQFIPGKTYIPASSPYIDGDDIAIGSKDACHSTEPSRASRAYILPF